MINAIYKSKTKISVEAGKIIYGTIDADKMKRTFSFKNSEEIKEDNCEVLKGK